MDSAGKPLNKFSPKQVSSQIEDSNCLKPKTELEANPNHETAYKKNKIVNKKL